MIESRKDCPKCGGVGVMTVGDGDFEGAGCHEEDCAECGGNGYVTVLAAVASEVSAILDVVDDPAPFSCDHPDTLKGERWNG